MRSPFKQPVVKDQLTLFVFVSVLFVVGAIFGALVVSALTLEQQQTLADDIDHYVKLMDAGIAPDGAATFRDRLLFHAKWLLLIWLLGTTVVGVPLVLALDFLKGVLVGFAVGTLVSQHAWKGAAFSLASVAPANILAVPAILIASAAAVSFAVYVAKNRILFRQGTLMPQFVSFSSTVLLMLFALAGAAFLEAYVSPVLIKWAAPLIVAAGL
ncbi:stage II sporulation protein M [Paenibacillus sp. 32O-W]|jgi:stage II sporulation protein M|uniref:Stage II sporulation protein M n=1 Tax=Paenibacillus cisolokensis TaxID=1658519 RepID=A0ABQ4NER9_9BACL|nr:MULTISPECIES: stage II sporulation protein M [Paenibacillus]ALS28377.1 stage II sporulation protein M [Paenibacillus sp. 32O-W]GIQ66722.1 stage II sporulation protein M [Paenibacillus cisolokensis]